MGMNRKKSARTIAPRLADGRSRVHFYNRLPPAIKEGMRKIARMERKSMSWVNEEVLMRYFKLPHPEYVRTTKRGKR